MIICSVTLNVGKFTYHKDSGTFSAEASDLRGHEPGQVFDDAADDGFWLQGKNERILYVRHHTEIDGDNDVRWWEYKPIATTPDGRYQTRKTLPYHIARTSVKIWND